MPTNNYWDSTYGRGIGGPNAAGSSSSSSSPYSSFGGATGTGYTPPSSGTQAAQGGTSNITASDWADWAKLAYGVYKDRNPTKPKFEDVPLSPEQKQMYQIYIQSMLNPATVNNASALNQMATQMLGGLSGMKWQSPKTFNGQPGYAGSNLSFTPPSSGAGGGAWPGTGGSQTTPPPSSSDSSNPNFGGGFTPTNDGRTTGGYVNGGPFNSDYAPGGVGTGPNAAGPSDMSGMMDMFQKYIGPWNKNQETYEKWISRGASIVGGMFGIPIPASLIDKGIDAVQWLYSRMSGKSGGAQQSPFDQFYNDPTGSGFGSAYGQGQRPPGMGGTPPAPGVGMTGGRNTGFSGFGAPGSMTPPPPAPSGYQVDPRTGGVTREDDPFNYGGYAGSANAANNANFWRGLMTPPGGGSPADSSTPVINPYARGFRNNTGRF